MLICMNPYKHFIFHKYSNKNKIEFNFYKMENFVKRKYVNVFEYIFIYLVYQCL